MYSYQDRNKQSRYKKAFGLAATITGAAIYLSNKGNREFLVDKAVLYTSKLATQLERGIFKGNISHVENSVFNLGNNKDFSTVDLPSTKIGNFIGQYHRTVYGTGNQYHRDSIVDELVNHPEWGFSKGETNNLLAYTGNHMDLLHTRGDIRKINQSLSDPLYKSVGNTLNEDQINLLSNVIKSNRGNVSLQDKNAKLMASILREQLYEKHTSMGFERGIIGNLLGKLPGLRSSRLAKDQVLKSKVKGKDFFENKLYDILGIRPVSLKHIVGDDFHTTLIDTIKELKSQNHAPSEFANELENALILKKEKLTANQKVVTRIAANLHIAGEHNIDLSVFHSGVLRTKNLGFNVDAISDVLNATKGFIYTHSNLNFGRANYDKNFAGILGGGQARGHVLNFINDIVHGKYHPTERKLDYDKNEGYRYRNIRTSTFGEGRYTDKEFTQTRDQFKKLLDVTNIQNDFYYLGNRVIGNISKESGENELLELPIRFQIQDTRFGFKKRYKEVRNEVNIEPNPIRKWFGDSKIGKAMDYLDIGWQKEENAFVKATSWIQRELFPEEGEYAKDPYNAYRKILLGSKDNDDVKVLLDGVLKATRINPNLDVEKLFKGVNLDHINKDNPNIFNLLGEGLNPDGTLKTSELINAVNELSSSLNGEAIEGAKYFGSGAGGVIESRHLKQYSTIFNTDPYYAYLRGSRLNKPDNVLPTERFFGTQTPQFGEDELKSKFLSEMIQQVFSGVDYRTSPKDLQRATGNIKTLLSNISSMNSTSSENIDSISNIWATWMSKNLSSNVLDKDELSNSIAGTLTGSSDINNFVESTVKRIFGFGRQTKAYNEVESGMELYAIPNYLPKPDNIDQTLGQRLFDQVENTPNLVYRTAFKTNDILSKAGLGLPDTDMVNTSSILTNLVLKRALPLGATIGLYNISSNVLNAAHLPGPRDVLSNIRDYGSLVGPVLTDYTGTTGVLKKAVSGTPGLGMLYYPRSIDEQQEKIARGYKSRRSRKKLFGGGQRDENTPIETTVDVRVNHDEIKRDNMISRSMLDFISSLVHPTTSIGFEANQSIMGMNIQTNPKNAQDFARRNYNYIKKAHPIRAAFVGGVLGSLIGKTGYSKPYLAAAGAAVSFGLSIGSTIGRRIDKKNDLDKVHDIERYYDMLKYIKNKRLSQFYANKSLKEEDFDIRDVIGEINPMVKNKRKPSEGKYLLGHLASKSLTYERKAEETITSMAMDDEVHPLRDIINVLPEYERSGVASVVTKGSRKDKRELYRSLDPTKKRVLGRYLGVSKNRLPDKEELTEFFENYQLPGKSWAGWGEDFNLEDAKVITAKQSHANMGLMHIHPGSVKEAYHRTKNTPIPVIHAHTAHIKRQLHEVLSAHGINNADINVSLVPSSNKSSSNISLDISQNREDEVVSHYK